MPKVMLDVFERVKFTLFHFEDFFEHLFLF